MASRPWTMNYSATGTWSGENTCTLPAKLSNPHPVTQRPCAIPLDELSSCTDYHLTHPCCKYPQLRRSRHLSNTPCNALNREHSRPGEPPYPLSPHKLRRFAHSDCSSRPPSDTTNYHGPRRLECAEVGALPPLPHPDIDADTDPSPMPGFTSTNSVRPRLSQMFQTATWFSSSSTCTSSGQASGSVSVPELVACTSLSWPAYSY